MKLNENTVKKLEEAFAIGCSIPEACYFANITKQTLYNWYEKMPELREKFDRLKERPVLKARATIFNNLDKTDTARWFLERKRKREFSTLAEVEENHNVTTFQLIKAEDTNYEEPNQSVYATSSTTEDNTESEPVESDSVRPAVRENNNECVQDN